MADSHLEAHMDCLLHRKQCSKRYTLFHFSIFDMNIIYNTETTHMPEYLPENISMLCTVVKYKLNTFKTMASLISYNQSLSKLANTPHTHSGNSEESNCQCRETLECGFNPCVKKIPWGREMAPPSSILAWTVPMDGSLPGSSVTVRMSD